MAAVGPSARRIGPKHLTVRRDDNSLEVVEERETQGTKSPEPRIPQEDHGAASAGCVSSLHHSGSLSPLPTPKKSTSNGQRRGYSAQVVKLNVGGTTFWTSLSTLCLQESYFKARFGGNFAEAKHMSSTREYFIDRDPTHFRHILNWLRNRNIPVLETQVQEELALEAVFYGLDQLTDLLRQRIRPYRMEPLEWAFNPAYLSGSHSLYRYRQKCQVVELGEQPHGFTLRFMSATGFTEGRHAWRVRVESEGYRDARLQPFFLIGVVRSGSELPPHNDEWFLRELKVHGVLSTRRAHPHWNETNPAMWKLFPRRADFAIDVDLDVTNKVIEFVNPDTNCLWSMELKEKEIVMDEETGLPIEPEAPADDAPTSWYPCIVVATFTREWGNNNNEPPDWLRDNSTQINMTIEEVPASSFDNTIDITTTAASAAHHED